LAMFRGERIGGWKSARNEGDEAWEGERFESSFRSVHFT
jgi:hypothetical protein